MTYAAGRRFEWHARDVLAANGFDHARAAGSKGKADLLAWKVDGDFLVIQCKTFEGRTKRRADIPGPDERREIVRLASTIPGGYGVPIVALKNTDAPDGIEWLRITGDGTNPKNLEPYRIDLVGQP